MKRILFTAIALISALTLMAQNKQITIRGQIKNLKDGKVILTKEAGKEAQPLFQGTSKEGAFSIKGAIDQMGTYFLKSEDRFLAPLMLEPGDTLFIEGEIDYNSFSDPSLYIKGNRMHQQYVSYLQELSETSKIEATEDNINELRNMRMVIVQKYIANNSQNLLGLRLASTWLKHLEIQFRNNYIDNLPQFLANDPVVLNMKKTIEVFMRTDPGAPYKDVKLPTQDGKEIALSDLLKQGKYVLVDFWGTSCVPCLAEMPYLHAAYKKYKDKGFEIYGISNDTNKEKWVAMLNKMEMNWINVCSLVGWKEPAFLSYDVNSTPANFLISPKGVIVGKNLRGDEIEAALSKIFL